MPHVMADRRPELIDEPSWHRSIGALRKKGIPPAGLALPSHAVQSDLTFTRDVTWDAYLRATHRSTDLLRGVVSFTPVALGVSTSTVDAVAAKAWRAAWTGVVRVAFSTTPGAGAAPDAAAAENAARLLRGWEAGPEALWHVARTV